MVHSPKIGITSSLKGSGQYQQYHILIIYLDLQCGIYKKFCFLR